MLQVADNKNKIIKFIEKVDRFVENIDYDYARLEIQANKQSYIVEMNKNKPIGFKVGDKTE